MMPVWFNLLLRGVRDVAHEEWSLDVKGFECPGRGSLLSPAIIQSNLTVFTESASYHPVEGVQLHLVWRSQHNGSTSKVISKKHGPNSMVISSFW